MYKVPSHWNTAAAQFSNDNNEKINGLFFSIDKKHKMCKAIGTQVYLHKKKTGGRSDRLEVENQVDISEAARAVVCQAALFTV